MRTDPPPLELDPDEVRRLADEILGRAEFAPPSRGLIQRVLDWIGDRIADVLDGLSPGRGTSGGTVAGGVGSGGSAILTVVLLVAAIVLVAVAVRALQGRWRIGRKPPSEDVEVEVEERRTVDEWEAAARRHEAVQEWKDGLRCRFRSLVERLVARGTVPDIAGRTSGEYRTDVAEAVPEAAADFAGAAELFERAWYGDLPTGPDEAGRFQVHAERVLDATGERR